MSSRHVEMYIGLDQFTAAVENTAVQNYIAHHALHCISEHECMYLYVRMYSCPISILTTHTHNYVAIIAFLFATIMSQSGTP